MSDESDRLVPMLESSEYVAPGHTLYDQELLNDELVKRVIALQNTLVLVNARLLVPVPNIEALLGIPS